MMEKVPIRVKVLYFGQAREAAGKKEEEFSLPTASSVKTLLNSSLKAHQELRGMHGSLRVAVNEEVAGESDSLADGDIVAFLPPVAGG